MKSIPSPELEACRIKTGPLASDETCGNNGAFRVRTDQGVILNVIASDGAGWEHVSVSPQTKPRTPTWEEMCFIKDLFWGPEEVVVQFHPARSQYVNCHPHTLHLWKPVGVEVTAPPPVLVGPRRRHKKGR
jgi:hypothetical protein